MADDAQNAEGTNGEGSQDAAQQGGGEGQNQQQDQQQQQSTDFDFAEWVRGIPEEARAGINAFAQAEVEKVKGQQGGEGQGEGQQQQQQTVDMSAMKKALGAFGVPAEALASVNTIDQLAIAADAFAAGQKWVESKQTNEQKGERDALLDFADTTRQRMGSERSAMQGQGQTDRQFIDQFNSSESPSLDAQKRVVEILRANGARNL